MSAVSKVTEFIGGVEWTKLVLPIAAVLIILTGLLSGNFGMVEIEPGEVAVVYNTTGFALFGDDSRVVRQQGTLTYFPFFQRVEVLDMQPQVLVMEGEKSGGINQVKKLTVRAKDGSSFWFDRLEIHYQMNAAQADTVLVHNGREDAYKQRAIAVHSREILRNEFGRYSFLEVADPSTYGTATTAAKEVMNKRLVPYGIIVTQIITPKPRFQSEVEHAIESRQTAEQEVEVQKEKRERLKKQKDRMVQDITQKKNAEYQTLLAKLEAAQKQAENSAISTLRSADAYFIQSSAKCLAYKEQLVTLAKANVDAYRSEAEGLAAQIDAVGAKGPDVLNLEIARQIFPQLKNIKALPYARAANPVDLRHINSKGGGRN